MVASSRFPAYLRYVLRVPGFACLVLGVAGLSYECESLSVGGEACGQ